MKKKKMLLAKVHDIWQSRLSINFEGAKKVTEVAVDVSLKSFKWEPQYKVRGQGTDVSLLLHYVHSTLYIPAFIIHYNPYLYFSNSSCSNI